MPEIGKYNKFLRIQSFYKKSKNIVATGHSKKAVKKIISTKISEKANNKSAIITNVLIKIPMAIEKATNPFLYSFFHGLKYVRKRRESDNNLITELFKEAKKLNNPTGASRYQNFKKINESFK